MRACHISNYICTMAYRVVKTRFLRPFCFFTMQEFIADIFIRQMWHDRRLAFSNNTEAIVLREDDIPVWLPDTYIDNSRKLLIQDGTRTVLILGNGTVLYTYR